MERQQGFIEEVVRSSGVCERDQVMNLYQTNPDLERYSDWSASWKTRRFKDIAAGMGVSCARIHLDILKITLN